MSQRGEGIDSALLHARAVVQAFDEAIAGFDPTLTAAAPGVPSGRLAADPERVRHLVQQVEASLRALEKDHAAFDHNARGFAYAARMAAEAGRPDLAEHASLRRQHLQQQADVLASEIEALRAVSARAKELLGAG